MKARAWAGTGEMLDKLARVKGRGLEAVRIAMAEGVPVVFGTDLLGHMQARQSEEFAIRSAVLSPVQILQSATIEAARLMRLEGQAGELGGRRLGRCAAGGWRSDRGCLDARPARHRHPPC
ncbi:amidohydrolase family protein [Paucibacter sp. O1-1]|nr:amidohydrolase family protein [Paucibacter sp. O1-1]MDA3829921.1 amidohydrolase family protein [Paucibacter sp. O1-1]